MRKSLVLLLAALLLAFLVTNTVSAQSTGSVRGTVKDPQGAAVPDAKVILTNTATNTKQDTTTNAEGLFVFAYVAPANYELTIQKENFRSATSHITVEVAQVVNLSMSLELGKITDTVMVSESALTIDTTSGELSNEISGKQLQQLPLLNRDYYNLMNLTATASDTGSLSGDTRGRGLAVGGARTSSVNFQLDGGENNDTFVAGVAQQVPLDAVQEFKVQTNGATAEYGRNPVVTNVVTKSGTNNLHGSAYEFYRGAGLSTSTFNDKANALPKSGFVRNQFGGSLGGRIIKDKLFYFGSLEPLRIRSSSTQQFYVPTATGFQANASANVNTYLTTVGGVPAGDCSNSPITSKYIWNTTEGNGGTPQNAPNPTNATLDYGNADISHPGNVFGLFPAGTPLDPNTGSGPAASLISSTLNMFCRAPVTVPADAGGGPPQNTWLTTERVDYQYSDRTNFFARYALQKETQPTGAASFSPYPLYNTGSTLENQNGTVALTHSFSPSLFGELRSTYNRVNSALPLGKAAATTPCWQYNNSAFSITPTGGPIVFPGYLPSQCSFAGLDTGGPQNVYQESGSMTKVMGKHTIKAGGSYFHMRFNYRFAAYENGYYESETMNDMLNGNIGFLEQAIDPRGHVPGEKYCPGPGACGAVPVDGSFQFPSFTRHYHYNETAVFGEDTYKMTSRLTVTYGVRWEYFGIPHSPKNEQYLDANLYLNAIGTSTGNNIFQQIANARFRRTNQFYRPDFGDVGPRLGLGYDIFGTGKTVFRAGYGMYFDRNFGNATFNAIQNPPNYAVLANVPAAFFGAPPGPCPGSPACVTIDPAANEFTMLNSAAAGTAFTVSSSARMLDNNLKTPRIQQYNATFEHNYRGILTSVSYVGLKGDSLYSLNNLNMRGSCLLLLIATPSAACNPAGGNSSRINQSGLSSMNRRGSEGLSRYNALAVDVRSQEIGKTGLLVNGTYTWAHSIDNESSFFADAGFEGAFGFGFKNPFNPAADRASSTNDIRNRGTISGIWDVPWKRNDNSLFGRLAGGWGLAAIFTAETGAAFSVYDGQAGTPGVSESQCKASGTNFCYPVLTGTGSIPSMSVTPVIGVPNTFTLYNLANAPYQTQLGYCQTHTLNSPLGTPLSGVACTAALDNLDTNLLAARNQFRTPGIWQFDASIQKNFRMPKEGHNLQLRADFLNVLNHSNLYANAGTNSFTSAASSVTGERGIPNCFPTTCGQERRNIQVSFRYSF